MTEPSQASTPTISVPPPAPAQVEEPEQQPIPNAPSFVICAPHVGTTDVSVAWAAPNEGAADSYLVEVGGASLEVDGSTFEVIVSGMAPGIAVSAKVTAKYKGKTADAGLSTPDDPSVKTHEPEDAPAPAADPAADPAPQGA